MKHHLRAAAVLLLALAVRPVVADVVRLAILDGIGCAESVSSPAGEFGAYGR